MNVCIVGMIYKSTTWLHSMVRSLQETTLGAPNIQYFVVANDPTPKVFKELCTHDIPHVVYNDPLPDDYYLNRVYRAWNFGGQVAADRAEVVVFVNSDMIFTEAWLPNLLKHLRPDTLPCATLIESGKLTSSPGAHEINCGQTLATFDKVKFLAEAERISTPGYIEGGLFMPCAFYTHDFVKSCGYPHGNICLDGVGAWPSSVVMSGDHYFFYYNPVMQTKQHITVTDSIVYHFQEGEKDEDE